MASVARYDEAVPISPKARSAGRLRPGNDGLAAFRTLAEAGRKQSLTALIESEVIPRLLVAHAGDAPRAAATHRGGSIASVDVEALARLSLQVEADVVLAHVDGVLSRGVAVDAAMVELLAPAARLLGEYWEDDLCDFTEVTMGLWRLQQIVHDIAARAPGRPHAAGGAMRALFASMPGDQHDFGTVVVDELFRGGGWQTVRASAPSTSELLKHAGENWFDLVGLTVSRDCHIATLPSVLVALRSVSRNARVCIMVGGRVFNADPELASRVGADGTASDARLALKVASDLVRARQGEVLING